MMFSEAQKKQMLDLAKSNIGAGLRGEKPLTIQLDVFDEILRAPGASFVTLNRYGQLRGCIGSLEPRRPLIEDIADNAWSAAFRDPRFAPLQPAEMEGLQLSISVLTPAQAMTFSSESDLLGQLRPGVDGLIFEAGSHRATFLPSVWQQLPEPKQFLSHLKQKAGLPADFWSKDVRVSRYQSESFE